MNGGELGVSDRVFLGNLKMNPGLEKWTVFWSETFRKEPGLVNWKDFFLESTINSERGVAEGIFLGKFPNGC